MSDDEENSKSSSALLLATGCSKNYNPLMVNSVITSPDHPLDLSVRRKSTTERSVSFHFGCCSNGCSGSSLLARNNGENHHPCRTQSVPASAESLHQSINFAPERCKSNSPFSAKILIDRPSVIIGILGFLGGLSVFT